MGPYSLQANGRLCAIVCSYIAVKQGDSQALLQHRGLPSRAPAGTWAAPVGAEQLNKAGLARLQAEHSSARLVRVANETLK